MLSEPASTEAAVVWRPKPVSEVRRSMIFVDFKQLLASSDGGRLLEVSPGVVSELMRCISIILKS